MSIHSAKYTVHGKVQGVFFRDSTVQEAKKLGVRGWVQNTPQSTVIGEIQGKSDAFASMKKWLQTTGSPSSRIDKTDFSDEKTLDDFTFSNFEQR